MKSAGWRARGPRTAVEDVVSRRERVAGRRTEASVEEKKKGRWSPTCCTFTYAQHRGSQRSVRSTTRNTQATDTQRMIWMLAAYMSYFFTPAQPPSPHAPHTLHRDTRRSNPTPHNTPASALHHSPPSRPSPPVTATVLFHHAPPFKPHCTTTSPPQSTGRSSPAVR